MIKILAPAKINLALDVLRRRPNGYHEVDMVMQPLTLADEIVLEPSPELELFCNQPQLPTDCRNLAWQAADLLRREMAIADGVRITIHKKIPVAAGLAGGSSDAAAVLNGLNQLWQLGLTTVELMELGLKLGADVPFCVLQQTARAQGIGEQLTPFASSLKCRVLIITPNVAVSTAAVYRQLVVETIQRHPQVTEVIAALQEGNLERLADSWGNVLEEVVLPRYPEVVKIKATLRRFGAVHCLMSGSGPSVFALDPPEACIGLILQELPELWFKSLCDFKN
ncbi:MAG TPA: 4-(cytidine 5'-diphospho)-2-C-methyl-D-erythritol kinase [Bacillota bacterium]